MNRFWDPLSTDPLEHPLPAAGNQAEVACAHMGRVWNQLRRYGDAVAIAVPAYFQRTQLGLLLGMCQELGIPMQGFVSLPVAAAGPGPEGLHLHVDVHLHRFEVSVLRAEDRLELQETVTVSEKGLESLCKIWAQAAAAEFVRMTRFDPFHSAETEQELYLRLPATLAALQQAQATTVALTAGHASYSISLTRAILLETARPVYEEFLAAVHDARRRGAAQASPVCIEVSQRAARLPGLLERLRQIPNSRLVELPLGAAALSLPALWRELSTGRQPPSGASFFKSRPWSAAAQPTTTAPRPTHLLYRSLAYPLSAHPLAAGSHAALRGRGIHIETDAGGVDSEHCTFLIQNGQVVLTDTSSLGTFLNDRRIEGPVTVSIGDAIRLGKSAETILAIACLDPHEA